MDHTYMGIRVLWDNEAKTTVLYAFDAQWAWEDFFRAFREAKALIDSVPYNVGVIFDASPPNLYFPPHLLSHLKNALRNRHERTKIVVAVIKNPFARAIVQSLMKIAGKDGQLIHIATSMDDARRLINQYLPQTEKGL